MHDIVCACMSLAGNRSRGNTLEIREDSGISDTPYTVFHDTCLPSRRKRTKPPKPYIMETTSI